MPSVFRVSDAPPTVRVVCADTVDTPVVDDVSVTEQLPVPPAVVHGFGVPSVPGPLSFVKLICVPSGAGTNPPPEPSFTFTCAVNVCVAPIRFVPFGVIEMFASTNVFTASPPLGATPSVCTVNGADPPTDNVEVACPVTFPAVGEVNVIVH